MATDHTFSTRPCAAPSPNPLVSFWLSKPSELENHRSTVDLPKAADVVIVGSGISGTLTAYHLLKKQPSLKILMLEARAVCSGATGRNGGQIKTDPYIAYEGFKSLVGPDMANEMLKFESAHIDWFKALLDEEKIACDFHITSAYDVCLNDAMAEIGQRSFRARQRDFPRDMAPFLEVTDLDSLERLSGVKGVKWGCVYRVGSIHPYKLVNGLLRRCFELAKAGGGEFNLQTQTPVIDLEAARSGWSVKTARGTVSAPKTVVCCNGYTSNVLPEFAGKIAPLKGACSALAIPPLQSRTTPSNEMMRPLFTSYSLKNDVEDFDYMISRQEEPNYIIVGGGHAAHDHEPALSLDNTDDTTQIPGTKEYFDNFMPKHFINYPEDKSRVAHLWTGIMGFSSDSGIPFVGPVPNRPAGLYMLGGFSGRGMVVKALTALMMDTSGRDARDILVGAGLPRPYVLSADRLERGLSREIAEGPQAAVQSDLVTAMSRAKL